MMFNKGDLVLSIGNVSEKRFPTVIIGVHHTQNTGWKPAKGRHGEDVVYRCTIGSKSILLAPKELT